MCGLRQEIRVSRHESYKTLCLKNDPFFRLISILLNCSVKMISPLYRPFAELQGGWVCL